MKKYLGIVVWLAVINLLPVGLCAQSVAPDSIVQIAADSQGLTQVASADLPVIGGTYWLVIPGGIKGVMALPLPCPPTDPTYPIYAIMPDGQQFLVDGTSGQVLPAG